MFVRGSDFCLHYIALPVYGVYPNETSGVNDESAWISFRGSGYIVSIFNHI